MENKDIKGLRLGGLLVGAAVLLFFTVEAGAMVAKIQFDDAFSGAGGTVSYAGGDAPLVGTDIFLDRILGLDTPANGNTSLNCDQCRLNFETGANIGGTVGGVTQYSWNGGGEFTITGGVSGALSIPGVDNILLEGSWNGPVTALVTDLGSVFSIVAGFGTDQKHSDLLEFFGLDDLSFEFANTNISADTTLGANDSFIANVTETDVVNTPSAAAPIPAAIWLFGSAMLGLIGIKRFGDRERHGKALAA